jgi:hypothetical protein
VSLCYSDVASTIMAGTLSTLSSVPLPVQVFSRVLDQWRRERGQVCNMKFGESGVFQFKIRCFKCECS